jgi:hypothetical protein
MRREFDLDKTRVSSFRSEEALSGHFGFAALRLRAIMAQTGNPTNVPSADDDRGDSDSTPAC